ncbi:Subtilisin-like protease SDD1 [Dendrobium catenatum]|uniref:Subtilisin-like protease SDD1 n=1 Tax=Dendrobium catenatum TaxID=906689 RepID=A0A2I0VJP5_9ASPA|nr:Subtilisin-like protease SDD1 [Dendrobium catenatum]
MEHCSPIVMFLLIKLILLLLLLQSSNSQLFPIVDEVVGRHGTQVYIIDVERHEQHELLGDGDLESFHRSFLPNSTLDSGEPRLVYSYRHVLSGFAARLTPGELEAVKSKPGFLYAQRDRRYQLATTYTPKYLSLTTYNAWGSSMMGQGIIIGVIDSGIKPTHPSFKDTNMPPKPPITKWKGNCSYAGFPCNNKIIGAKGFYKGSHPSPKDTEGHGTHVAGTAAGNFVKDANILGMAKGDPSSGMAPMAYLSIYKVCFPKVRCGRVDTYAAIDQAIKDGVDIISMSIGGFHNDTLYEDVISRGSMAAIQHGIIPVAAAGNDGPMSVTLSHSAPWVLTVGASTTDRRIASTVELGDGRTFLGESAYQPNHWNSTKKWELEYLGKNGDVNASYCLPNELAKFNLRGKIVICEISIVTDEIRGKAAYQVGAEGMIVINEPSQGHTTLSPAHVLPASNIDHPARLEILDYYYNNQPNAFASIRFNGTQFGFTPSPTVASFSSRGPSRMNGGIIKPDVLAPGVNILAAWPRDVGPHPNPLATHTFTFESGTSMATPHVSGIAALVRSKHLGWTPAEIISAIVTTSNDSWTDAGDLIVDDILYKTAGIYATGAGQVNPIRAVDPGLVFGLTLNDYIGYLCGLGYNDKEVTITIGKQTSCNGVKYLTASELNYPSIAINLTRSTMSQTVSRTVKNVGDANEDYSAKITEPVGVAIYLSTYKLKFTRLNQEESYNINFVLKGAYPSQGSDMIRRGKIVWDSGKHVVTTPIAVRFV